MTIFQEARAFFKATRSKEEKCYINELEIFIRRKEVLIIQVMKKVFVIRK